MSDALHFGPHPMPFRRGAWAVKVERLDSGWWARILQRGETLEWMAGGDGQEALDRLWAKLRLFLDPLPDEPLPEGGEGADGQADVVEPRGFGG